MIFKRIFLSLMFLGMVTLSAWASCYTEWLDSYSMAEEELSTDIARCQYSSWRSRCSYEANLSYNRTINIAGTEYYNCVNRR